MQILPLVLTVVLIAAPQLQMVTSLAPDMDTGLDKISQEMRQMREEMREEMSQKMRYIGEEMTDIRDEMKEEMRQLRQETTRLREEMSVQMEQMTGEVSDIKAQMSPVDASFTAFANGSPLYDVGDVIQFDGIIHNYGDHYDPVTSTFTCPVSGFYLFYVNLYSNYQILAEIYVEGEGGLSEAFGGADITFDHGSTLSVTWCDEGQGVWVECIADGRLFQANDYKYTVFSGTVLQYTKGDIHPYSKLSN